MIPNRRSRDEQARKARAAGNNARTAFDDSQATVVPHEDVVPEPTRPGRINDYAPEVSQADIELSTSDIRINDLSGEINDPDYQPTRTHHPAVKQPPQQPAQRPSGRHNGQFDFSDESQATRIDPRIDPKRDRDLALSSVEVHREPPTRETAAPTRETRAPAYRAEPPAYRAEASAYRPEPPAYRPEPPAYRPEPASYQAEPGTFENLAPRVVQARKLPLEEFPNEKSVVARIVQSVVAVLPQMLRKAVDRSVAHNLLPGVRKEATAPEEDSRPKENGVDAQAWREMRTSPIFDGLPNEALRDALMSGDAQVLKLQRDSLVPLDKPQGGSLALVRIGQVALGKFTEESLAAERKARAALETATGKPEKLDKKERKRRNEVGPLIRVAEQNLATFEEGDVVETSVGAAMHNTLAAYATTPATVITIGRARVELWKRIYPFMADRFRRAAAAARAKVEATDGAKAAVADFFIRHGLSVSVTLRVRKLDACIECKACEIACEERYGVKRLSINGRILGNLDFVDACHTCTDARCIDPCNFDAISYDAVKKEILIKEDACTGCTMCATACPYNAIEMHDLDDTPLLKLRLSKEKKLAHGDGTARKAKLRRIASKCDHCASYNDQACISACPTGALLEVLPSDAVTQMPDQARASAKAGFDRTVGIDVGRLNEAQAFAKGGLGDLPNLGRAKAKRGQLSLAVWWTIGILSLVISCLEIALRLWAPRYSVAFLMDTLVEGIDPELALAHIDFRPGSALATNFGYVGTALMLQTLFYVARRRLGFMRSWGSLQSWFEWHVITGIIGPIYILLHSVGKLDNWVSLGFWSMMLTVISGLLGRYMATQIEERASTAAVEVLDIDRKMGMLRASQPGVRAADVWYEAYQRRIANFEKSLGGKEQQPTFFGALRAFWFVTRDDFWRGPRLRGLRNSLKKTVHGGRDAKKFRKEAAELAHRLALMERRRVLLPRLQPIYDQWKAVHVPMSVVMTVIVVIHVFIEWRR